MNKFTSHQDVSVHLGVCVLVITERATRNTTATGSSRGEAGRIGVCRLWVAEIAKGPRRFTGAAHRSGHKTEPIKGSAASPWWEGKSHIYHFMSHSCSMHIVSVPPCHGDWSGSLLRSDKSCEILGSHGMTTKIIVVWNLCCLLWWIFTNILEEPAVSSFGVQE